MPVNVPDEPKKYTTVYDNFKGVDFTDDASNVYKRRSPTGKNMLPDLDGRPYKRTGWEVKLTNADYVVALGAEEYSAEESYAIGDYVIYNDNPYICVYATTGEAWDENHWELVEIDPQRTHYFSYDSFDFLMVFNSLGVFYYNNMDYTLHKAQMWSNNQATDFPPEVTRNVDGTPTLVTMPADANRAFFFEGAGTAGFYTFVESDLYRFGSNAAGGYYFFKVTPTIPIVLIGCDPTTGVGTDNQSLNMLTDKRTIEYFGDGSTTKYQLPSTPDENSISVEELSQTTGQWETKAHTYDSQEAKVVITPAPAASTVGNIRITYAPSAGSSYSLSSNVETNRAQITNKRTTTSIQYRERIEHQFWDTAKKKWVTDHSGAWVTGPWSNQTNTTSMGTATLATPNIYDQNTLKVKANYTGSFVDVNPTKKWGAYNANVDVTFNDASIADTYGTEKTTISGWSQVSSIIINTNRGESRSPGGGGGSGASGGSGGSYTARNINRAQKRTKTVTKSKSFTVYGTYTHQNLLAAEAQNQRDAFNLCRKVLNFGNNISNQVFIAATSARDYKNRVWYCAANDPTYFPDTNYVEVGADDKEVMGLIKVGSYLGIVKKGSGTEASIYLAYATSFENETAYAVKQSVSGIGAISNGAFNILNEEPLFLSREGIMGINVDETDINKQLRNRSFYINKRLKSEPMIENAISFVHKNLYYLAINDHCYVLDGSQKTSWANEKTNLQYECYYLDNIPAQCFASFDGDLYFTDNAGSLCRFKRSDEPTAYIDEYSVHEADWVATQAPVNDEIGITQLGGASDEYSFLIDSDDDYLCVYPESTTPYDPTATYAVGDIVHHDGTVYACIEEISTPEEWNEDHWEEQDPIRLMVMSGQADINGTVSYLGKYYTVIEVYKDKNTDEEIAKLANGVPIKAEWSTIADDDDMVHFFKNLNKKGCVISLLPGEGSYVQVLIKPDEKDPVDLGFFESGMTELPADLIVKKKIKKYKRLQFIVRDDWYNDGFALDQIIKTYTVGNYSKNRK